MPRQGDRRSRDWALIAIALVVGCGKSTKPAHEKAPTGSGSAAMVTSPECVAKVKELGPWLEQLAVEQASHEIDFGYELQVIDRAPLPMPQKIDVLIAKKSSLVAYDLAGDDHNQVEVPEAATDAELDAAAAAMFATKPDPTDKYLPPPDLVRIDVDPAAKWIQVVRIVAAAKKAGYTRAMFAFTATSKLVAPVGSPSEVTSADEMSKVTRRLEELGDKDCTALSRAALHHAQDPDRAANARAMAKETAAAIAECNCAASPDEIRALKWLDAHWHQATIRVPVIVSLAGTPTEIAFAKTTPWSEAHAQLIAAAPDGQPPPAIQLVVK